MDKMIFKNSTVTAGASAYDHHNEQEAAMGVVVEGATRNQQARQQQAMANGGAGPRDRSKLRPPPPEEAPRCPRCDSGDTKFCYYNNYSFLQPRYFCKGCRRYWTHGGSLRNVPVGGGCRKNRRSTAVLLPPPSSSSAVVKKDEQQQHQHQQQSLVVPASSASGPIMMPGQEFPNVLPTFMSAGFELPAFSPPPPMSLSSGLAPPLAACAAGTGPTSFLEMLRGGFLDNHQSDDFCYEPASSAIMEPPQLVFGAVMHSGDAAGATPVVSGAGTHQGAQWPARQAAQQEGAGAPGTARG